MWDLTRPGIEPVSPALAGGFLTTVPREVPSLLLNVQNIKWLTTVLPWATLVNGRMNEVQEDPSEEE